MKVKEIDRTANVAWSPASQYPIYLAAATAAQQLDATFSTSAAVELYEFNLGEPGLKMKLAGTMESNCRFHKLVWGPHGTEAADGGMPNGCLVGGAENGTVHIWNPAKLMAEEDPLVEKLEKHVGGVAALDINPFQSNLLATGASDSEIYIWDLNNTASPMTPGAKSQPPDDVTCLAWNQQVQHILSSTYAGRCIVWDLRKNEPIIKVSDSMSRIKCKLIAWHPEVATQMCLASEDDHTPVIQLWDLRFATSPLKSLENHQRGILSMAWCAQDPDLLLTCGKDNRILCWNPNSTVQGGEVVYELPTSNQWSFDIKWCPRNPAVISSCSFDGHISVYSLMGGSEPTPSSPTPVINAVTDAFGQGDPFSNMQAQQQQAQTQQAPATPLKRAPKWLRRPVGASFGFGGKLVTFEYNKPEQPGVQAQHIVHVSQVVTECDFVERSTALETALATPENLRQFCTEKATSCSSQSDQDVWNFMKVQFEKDPRSHYLQLLGYDKEELSRKVKENPKIKSNKSSENLLNGDCADDVTEEMSQLDTDDPALTNGHAEADSSAFDNIAASVKAEDSRPNTPLPISTQDDFEGLVTQALLVANFEAAVEVCLQHDKMAEAMILAIAGGTDLLTRTQNRYFKKNQSSLGRLISSLVTRNFEHIIRTCDLDNWKEALGVALTYAQAEEFGKLCDVLGSRLEFERDGSLAASASLCYICAGNVDKLVSWWDKFNVDHSPAALQDLVERVMVLRAAVSAASGQASQEGAGLAEQLAQYSALLAAQGSMETAMRYIGTSKELSLSVMRDRLGTALGYQAASGPTVQRPFNVVNVASAHTPATAAPVKPVEPKGVQQRQPVHSGYQATANNHFNTSTTQSPAYSTPKTSYPTSQPLTSPAPAYAPQPMMTPASGYQQHPVIPAPQQPMTSQPQAPPPQAPPQAHRIHQGTGTAKYPTYPQSSSYSQGGYGAAATPDTSMYQAPQPNTSMYSQAPQPNMYNPGGPGGPYAPPPAPPAQPALPAHPTFQEVGPVTGWNDPPALTKSRKRTESQEKSYEAPAPITAPVYGAPEQAPPGAPNYASNTGYMQPTPTSQYQQPAQAQPSPAARPAAEPAAPAPKQPIPAEHQLIHDVLNNLATQCLTNARNPPMRRKLEDVVRKLEFLYDKLRDGTLSDNVLTGLHAIVGSIQQYDYNTGIQLHSQVVSQANFAEIAAFMPAVKVLIHTASQLQVYIQQ